MRAIAHASGVDAALIHHFFVSKEALFTLAMRDAFSVIDLVPSVVDGYQRMAAARRFISSPSSGSGGCRVRIPANWAAGTAC